MLNVNSIENYIVLPNEICDNKIDDDGDGLVDAFDPDCICDNTGSTIITFIENFDFEEHTDCCSQLDLGMSCVDGWHAIDGTPDYYGLDCENASAVEGILINQFDDSFVSFGTSANYSESLGSCLLSPLVAGEEYAIEISAGFPVDFLINLNDPIAFTLYGFSNPCPDFSTFLDPTLINLCESGLVDQAEEIITISSDDVIPLEFTEFSANFTPSNDINFVVLSIKCDPSNTGLTFLNVANVQISKEAENNWIYDDTISISDFCINPLSLSLPYSDTLNYQWYLDSLPINGASNSELSIDPSLYDENNQFHIYVYNEYGCELIGPTSINSIANPPTVISESICAGDTFFVDNTPYTSSGNFDITLLSTSGCDSLVKLELNVSPYITSTQIQSICEGDSYNFGGQLLFSAGTYLDTIQSLTNCDSLITLTLSVIQIDGNSFPISICDGTTYNFGGKDLTIEGIYSDTLSNQFGCDSIVTLNLNVQRPVDTLLNIAICENETYNFHNSILSAAGTYSDTLSAMNGCDSIVNLILLIDDYNRQMISSTICSGDDYDFNGRLINASGLYLDTIQNFSGCDSILTLSLTVSDYIKEDIDITICSGNSYLFNNNIITQAGSYVDTITSSISCDSIITLRLVIDSMLIMTTEDVICEGDSYNFGGTIIYDSGIYFDTLFNTLGCDTIEALILTTQGELSGDTTYASIANGATYNFNGIEYDEEGFYSIPLSTIEGCDSIAYLDLKTLSEIHLPNAISTNSLNGNERFIIASDGDVQIDQYKIYDRWGNLMFSRENFKISDGGHNFWNGKMNNRAVAQGVYLYFITYRDAFGDSKELVGSLTVL